MVVSVYIFTKYIKATAFQTSPFEKKRNKQLKFQISSFKHNFQTETIVSISSSVGSFSEQKIKNCVVRF